MEGSGEFVVEWPAVEAVGPGAREGVGGPGKARRQEGPGRGFRVFPSNENQ